MLTRPCLATSTPFLDVEIHGYTCPVERCQGIQLHYHKTADLQNVPRAAGNEGTVEQKDGEEASCGKQGPSRGTLPYPVEPLQHRPGRYEVPGERAVLVKAGPRWTLSTISGHGIVGTHNVDRRRSPWVVHALCSVKLAAHFCMCGLSRRRPGRDTSSKKADCSTCKFTLCCPSKVRVDDCSHTRLVGSGGLRIYCCR